jgi:hypothetical protein
VAALIVAALLVVSGADLRSKIPAMRDWLTTEEELSAEREAIVRLQGQELILDSSNRNPRILKREAEYKAANEAHRNAREETLTFGSETLHTDWLVGLGIYLFLVVLGAIKVIIGTDPYFEYQLLAQSIRGVRESRLRLAAAKDALANWRRYHVERYTEQINSLRSLLWLIAPSDPLALKPKLPDGKDAPSPSTSASAAEIAAPELPENYGAIWVSDRLRNYTRAYAILRGFAVSKAWPVSFKEAMSCET